MEKRLEHGVHQALEGGWRVRDPKGHDQEHEVAFMGVERWFLDVFSMQPHLVVPEAQIKLSEEVRAIC